MSDSPPKNALPAIEREERGHRGAFYMERDGERLASLTFSAGPDGKIVMLDHTEVFAESLRGQGVARKLVEAAVDWARKTDVKLVAVCPFAKAIFDRVPELREVLA
jgi:predicted GNAT family acetyltransferase